MKRSGYLPMAKLAYEDPKFMESLGARPLRILAEYLDPLKCLRQQKVGDTIVMFGSARIQSHDRAVADLEKVKRKAKGRRTPEWRAKITPGARDCGDVALLRRCPRAIAQNHFVGHDAGQ